MATYYLDYKDGNDAAAGTSFATRWKTITLGATAARIAPGDTVRIMASPTPTSVGINATWTLGSSTVTLASSVTQAIYNDGAWTGSAQVTSTAGATNKKLGSNAANLAIVAGFTTGLIAYYDIGSTIDLSAYQQISLWMRTSVTSASSVYEIKLCSDAVGAVPVDTFSVPAITGVGFRPITIDKGSALSSTVRSIAIYAVSDPGALTLVLDNIIACKASSADDSITLSSLISKNTTNEPWYAIRSIGGTSITLDTRTDSLASVAGCLYSGTTETVAIYKRETIKTAIASATTAVIGDVMDSGTFGSLITFSGGWNRTDMSTQTGETYFDGLNGIGVGLRLSSKNYISLEKIGLIRYTNGLVLVGTSSLCSIDILSCSHNSTAGIDIQANTVSRNTFTNIGALNGNGTGLICDGYTNFFTNINHVDSNLTNNIDCASGKSNIFTNINTCSYSAGNGITLSSSLATNNSFLSVGSITGCTGQGLDIYGSDNIFKSVIIPTSVGPSVWLRVGAGNNKFYNCSFNSSVSYTVFFSDRDNFFFNCLNTGLSECGADPTYIGSGSRAVFIKNDQTANQHKIYFDSGLIGSDATVVEAGSSYSWRVENDPNRDILYPLTMPVAKVAVSANALVTASIRMRRDSTNATCGLRCLGGQIAGVAADVTAALSGAINTWADVTITFTPTETGVVELECYSYSTSLYPYAYIGAISISQA